MEELLINYCSKKCERYNILSNVEKGYVQQVIEETYIRKNARYSFSLFDILKVEESVAVNQIDAWRWVHDYIQDKSIIVFFDYKKGDYIELLSGNLFTAFYEECPKDEFYIIDRNGGFLLGYNHSNCFFTMGKAAQWLENYEKYIELYGG